MRVVGSFGFFELRKVVGDLEPVGFRPHINVLGRLFSQRLIDHANSQPEDARNSVDPAVKRASTTATEGPVFAGPGFKFGDPVLTGRKSEPDSLNRRTGRKGTAG